MKHDKKIRMVFAGILILGLSALKIPGAYAVFDAQYDSKEDLGGQYEASSEQKLTRGTTNLLLGWTEIARTPAKMSAGIEHGALTSFLVGVPYGILRFAGRTAVGVYEIVTCYAPQSPIMSPLEGDVV